MREENGDPRRRRDKSQVREWAVEELSCVPAVSFFYTSRVDTCLPVAYVAEKHQHQLNTNWKWQYKLIQSSWDERTRHTAHGVPASTIAHPPESHDVNLRKHLGNLTMILLFFDRQDTWQKWHWDPMKT